MTHQKVYDFLHQHPMGILATADKSGAPWGSAIYFVADEYFNLFFVTRSGTRKFENIEQNPIVSLTVADAETQTTVQVAGTISKVPPHDYMDVVFHKLDKIRPKDDDSWAPPLSKIHKGNFVPLRITPTKLVFSDFGKFKLDPNASYVEEVIG